VPVTVLLTPAQRALLRTEALQRQLDRGAGKADASEVVRELIDQWNRKR